MKYKPEIDGLRSIAVLSVLVFHLGSPHIPGGFTGVDLFFVISGYLITGIIAGDMQERHFSLANFYRRRVLRILPPLLVLLLFVTLVGWLIFLPVELINYGKTVVWTVLFSSNIFFFKEINYFNPEAKFNPLLHIWSLAVEEQFYIVVPILLWLLFRFSGRYTKPLFVATVVISFVLSVVLVFISQKTTFYMLPTRYWELGIGSILALYGLHQRVSGRMADAISMLGLTLIAAGLLLVDDTMPFPGPAALPSTLGAAFIIIAGMNGVVGRLLARPVPIFIGKISYSLYLWHWPIIVFYRLWIAPQITLLPGIAIGLLSFLLAVLSYYWVETPPRRVPKRIGDFRVLGVAAACLVAFAVVGASLQRFAVDLRSYPPEVAQIAAYDDYDLTAASKAQYRRDQCFITSGSKGGAQAFREDICLASNGGGKPDYLLIGDSQAAHLWQALQQSRTDINLMQATASGCKPTLDTVGESRCVTLIRKIFKEWLPARLISGIILSARWESKDVAGLVATIEELKRLGVPRIVVLGPTVEYSQSFPLILAREAWKGSDNAADFKVSARLQLDHTMADTLEAEKVTYLSVYNAACPDDHCIETVEQVPVQSDYGHFTDAGARLIASRLASSL